MTDKQTRILAFIRDYIAEQGRPPTIRSIMDACAISSTSVVNYNLGKLEAAGWITRQHDYSSRGIRLVQQEGAA